MISDSVMISPVTFRAVGRPFQAGDFKIVHTSHPPRFRLARHDHSAATMVIVESGDFHEMVGQRSFYCELGSILVKPDGAHHRDTYGASGSKAILVELPEGCAVREISSFRDARVARRLALELRYGDVASALVIESILIELCDGPPRMEERRRPSPPRWLREVEQRLRLEPTTVATLAVQADKNPAHLAREFRRHYGCSPGDYARVTRIERSCQALRRTAEPISSIALEAGFYDQSHFTNVFRRLVGTTPAEYRRRSGNRTHEISKTCGDAGR